MIALLAPQGFAAAAASNTGRLSSTVRGEALPKQKQEVARRACSAKYGFRA